MIDLACPSCGRAGQVPPAKLHTRLVCKKCHVVFHVDTAGRPIIGEPQIASAKDQSKRAQDSEHHSVFEGVHIPSLNELTHLGDNLSNYTFPVKPVLGVLGVLVVGWLVFTLTSGPGEQVSDRSRQFAEVLAHDDLEGLKAFATDKTRDDVVRWYDAAHSRLEQARASWPTKEASVQVLVVEEDRRSRKGEVDMFLVPAQANTQTASVLPTIGSSSSPGSSGKQASSADPVSFHLHWIWSGKHWMIDGHQSLAVIGR
jgi:hypothetical protein